MYTEKKIFWEHILNSHWDGHQPKKKGGKRGRERGRKEERKKITVGKDMEKLDPLCSVGK